MRKILIGRRDFVRHPAAVFSGGSWAPGLPLSNLADINPQFVAEVTDNQPTSATFDIDLGYQRRVGVFHFQNLRASSSAILSLKAGTDPTFATNGFETLQSAWPRDSDPLGNTPWGEWTLNGVYSSDEYVALGLPRFFVPPAVIPVRYIRVAIKDNTGPALQIGCFGAFEVWEPPYNISYGWGITAMDESEVSRVPFGSTYVTSRGMRRRMNFGFKELPQSEFLTRSLGLGLIKGKSEPLVVVPFPEDTANLEKTSIYGLFSQDPQFANPFFAQYEHSFAIDQLI